MFDDSLRASSEIIGDYRSSRSLLLARRPAHRPPIPSVSVLSLSLTGPTSPAGKQVLAGLEIWRDDVNAKGGLLGRPVELVYYDDQGNPANAPGIYAKLMGVDKVELLIGPYSTNVIAAAHAGDHPGEPHDDRHFRARREPDVQVSALFLDEFAGRQPAQLFRAACSRWRRG